jgi:hypothetical protein
MTPVMDFAFEIPGDSLGSVRHGLYFFVGIEFTLKFLLATRNWLFALLW